MRDLLALLVLAALPAAGQEPPPAGFGDRTDVVVEEVPVRVLTPRPGPDGDPEPDGL